MLYIYISMFLLAQTPSPSPPDLALWSDPSPSLSFSPPSSFAGIAQSFSIVRHDREHRQTRRNRPGWAQVKEKLLRPPLSPWNKMRQSWEKRGRKPVPVQFKDFCTLLSTSRLRRIDQKEESMPAKSASKEGTEQISQISNRMKLNQRFYVVFFCQWKIQEIPQAGSWPPFCLNQENVVLRGKGKMLIKAYDNEITTP